jgi:hypothetical protein
MLFRWCGVDIVNFSIFIQIIILLKMLEFTQNIAIIVISVNAKLTGSTLIFAATVRGRMNRIEY